MSEKSSECPQNRASLPAQMREWMLVMLVLVVISLVCNRVGYRNSMAEALPGMMIFMALSVAGLLLAAILPGKLPAVCYIALLGMMIAAPISPIAPQVIAYGNKVNLMAVVTPILAYAGVLIGKDWNIFLKIGWQGLLVSVLVLLGTFFTSSGIAEILMRIFY